MSRVGRNPIQIPKGVKIAVVGNSVTVEGPKGTLSRNIVPECTVEHEGATVVVKRQVEGIRGRSMHGLTRALLANMVKGVSDGFTRELLITGVGYKAEAQGTKLTLNLGFSQPIELVLPKEVKAKVEDKNTRIILESYDKEVLGQIAAKIRAYRPPEPYKGKGVKYAGEVLRRKAGKSSG